MNTFIRLAGTAMPGFSTDQTASSVNRFISQRPMLTSRPETSEQRRPAAAPVPPEILYPALYAQDSSPVQHCRDYLSAIVVALANRLSPRDTHSSRIIISPEQYQSEVLLPLAQLG